MLVNLGDVKSACENLGFDPIYIANAGCFALFVPASESEKVLALLRKHALGKQAQVIAKVLGTDEKGVVTVKTSMGISRVVELFSGEQLLRIC